MNAKTNREKAPEFAAFVDRLREKFGPGVKVRWVRFADGTELGHRTPQGPPISMRPPNSNRRR